MTKRSFAIILTFCGVLFISGKAFGAGGACPSAANYLTTTGSLTTLSSLGVTNCYYAAANGSDANNGTSEATPFLHAPGMPQCSGNCATAQKGMQPGTGIILRGGDTWHLGNSSASPYAGAYWGNPGHNGTSANPMYEGVDTSWYSGSSWARPILNGDNPITTSQTLSACTYPATNDMLWLAGGAYFIVDNLELTGLCTSSSYWNAIYVNYGSFSGSFSAYNLYIHGWSHVGFPNVNNCTANSTCMSAFRGSTNVGPPYDTLLYDVVDGSDSDPVPMELCYCGAWHIGYSYFNNGSQFITRTQNSFHDSVISNFVDNGHANVMESMGDIPGPSNAYAFYNNVFQHIYVSSSVTSNVCFWPNIPVGSTLYWFNNVIYDVGPCELFNDGENGANEGTLVRFNDTFQNNHRTDGGANGFSCSATGNSDPYQDANIQFISDDVTSLGSMYGSDCNGQGSNTTSLVMSNSTASSDGFVSSLLAAFSPTLSSSPTVGKGTNEGGGYCSALSSAASADPYLSAAAAACQKGTDYACSYNSSAHAMTCPAESPAARPVSGNWDIGAYQYSNGAAPLAPSNLVATPH